MKLLQTFHNLSIFLLLFYESAVNSKKWASDNCVNSHVSAPLCAACLGQNYSLQRPFLNGLEVSRKRADCRRSSNRGRPKSNGSLTKVSWFRKLAFLIALLFRFWKAVFLLRFPTALTSKTLHNENYFREPSERKDEEEVEEEASEKRIWFWLGRWGGRPAAQSTRSRWTNWIRKICPCKLWHFSTIKV